MNKLNKNSDNKKNQADNGEIQEFFKSKAYLDKPIISNPVNQRNMVEKKIKNKKEFSSKLKKRPIELDLFSFEEQEIVKEEKRFHSIVSTVDINNGTTDCLLTISQVIGVILREKRKGQNLTQNKLAEIVYNDGRYQSLISRIEKGEYSHTSFQDVALILGGMGIDLIELIANTNLNDGKQKNKPTAAANQNNNKGGNKQNEGVQEDNGGENYNQKQKPLTRSQLLLLKVMKERERKKA